MQCYPWHGQPSCQFCHRACQWYRSSIRLPSLKFIGLSVPRIWHGAFDRLTSNCGHGSPVSCTSFLSIFSFAVHLHSQHRARHRQTTAISALCRYRLGAGHNKIRIRKRTKMGNREELMSRVRSGLCYLLGKFRLWWNCALQSLTLMYCYGVEIYGNSCGTYFTKLTSLNNKILRILQNKLYDTDLYRTYGTLPVLKQEAQLMLTTGSTRLAVSGGQQTWYHSTCNI